MSATDKLSACCLVVSKVPKSFPREEIEKTLKLHLTGNIVNAEEVSGSEADSNLTRYIFLLDSKSDVAKLLEVEETDIDVGGESYTIDYQQAIPCEIPEQWDNIKIPNSPKKPPIPQRRLTDQNRLQQQHQQNVGIVGMMSGIYENLGVPGPSGPADPTNDPNMAGHAQQPNNNPNPGFGYPPTSEQNQANYSGNQGYPNFPPQGQGQSYFYPPDAGNNPQAPPYGPPHGPPPALPPGMMLVQDPNTKMVFMVPIPGYQHRGQPQGQPQGQPPPYAEQENFNTQNVTEKKLPPDSSNDPVVTSKAVNDQRDKEERLKQQDEQQPEQENPEEEEVDGDVNSEHDGGEQTCKLLISDIPSTVDDEYITWFFERKKNFGGLEVEDVVYNEEEGIAIVEFGSPDDIEAVLEKVPIKMKGKEVSVDRYEPEPEVPIDPCCVQVTGPQDIVSDLETLEYYFESKRSCGGDIADIRYDEDLNLTVIRFENEEDAQRVIEKYEHEVDGETLTAEQYTPRNSKQSPGGASPRQQDMSDDEDFQDATEEIRDTVRVSGVIPSIRSTAELYFENTRRSGGGEVESMWDDEDSENTVYIKFVNAEDAQNVLEREHIVKGKSLTVELYSPGKKARPDKQRKQETVPVVQEEVEEVVVMDTVKVTGVDPAKRSTIELYFENRRRSGGGEYDKLWSDEEEEGVIYIKFKTEEVARNVASRSHTVEKCELKVTLYTPPKPPPCYEDKILIKGLKETTSQDGLFNFIEAKSGFIPKSLDNHESETGVVMVTFESKPDIDKLEAACKKYQLEGSTLKISPVAVSSCIMVSELPETVTKDTLQFYFENHRKSGGGEVDKVVMNDDDTWLVYFIDYTVIDKVLQKKHVLSNQTIIVQRYQECLGRPEGDVKERKLKIPEPVILTEVDKDKVKFLKNSPKNQQCLQNQLNFAKIVWPNRDEDIKIECTITQSVENCYKLVKSWKKDVLTCVNSFIADIVVVKTSVLQGAWQNVIQKLQEISIEDPESVALFVDSKANLITHVGSKRPVDTLKTRIEALVKDVMDEMERERQKVTEVINNLKKIDTKMLLADKFPEQMEKKFKIQMKININKNELVFEGPTSAVRDAKLEMHERKGSFAYKKLDKLPKLCVQLYDLKQCREYIVKEKLKAARVTAVWDKESDTAIKVCSNNDDIEDSFGIVQSSVRSQFIALKKEQGSLINSEKWREKVLEVQKLSPGKCLIEVDDDFNKVIVCGTDDVVDDSADAVRKFLRLNTLLSEKLTCTKEAHRLIVKHHNTEIESIAKTHEQYNVQIISPAQYGTFQIKGTEDGIRLARTKLQELLRRVQKRDHTIDKPGLGEYIGTPKGKDSLNTVETSYPVVITQKTNDDGDDDDDDDGFEFVDTDGGDAVGGSGVTGIEISASCKLYDTRQIYCGTGDMTEMNVEVLVNTANDKLSFAGGLGKVILRKGGKTIEKECQDYIKSAGKLSDGEAFMSSAGDLKAQYIVHIRGPAWKGGTNSEEDMLEEAVFKCMQMASSKGATSIAMPAISCGAFGYPVQKATSTIVSSVKNYFREDQDSTITDVYLCDVKSETVEAFSNAMSSHIGSVQKRTKKTSGRKPAPRRGASKFSDDDDDDDGGGGARGGKWKPPGGKKVLPAARPRASNKKQSDDSISVNGVTIRLVKAEIAREKADMIVNTTARNLDLKNGAVSTSLLRAAGSGLQDELTQNYPNGIKDGEIATTTGHKLKCSHVVHTSLSSYDRKNPSLSRTSLHQLMKNCLDEAENQGATSIAFPAIGTGQLGYPKELVATEMFQAASKHAFTSVTEVKFIVYQKDLPTIQAFSNELERLQGSGGRGSTSNYDDNSDYGDNSDDEADSSDRDGIINVIVKQGDITSESADCIVNSSNEDLDLSRGAVSKSILKKGGKELEKALSKLKSDMKKDHLVVTEAPNMKCKKIIHIVAADTTNEWKRVIFNCLDAAEKHKLTSIAFPALGTGMRIKASDIAPVMVKGVREFEQTRPRHLCDVRFVIFQDSMVNEFKQAIGEQKSGGARSKGPTGRGKKSGATMSVNSVTFVIRSLDGAKINEAIKKLEYCIDREILSQDFDDSIIKKFDDVQARDIQQIVKKYQLNVKLDISRGQIKIDGLNANVNSAANEIHQLLRKVQATEKDKKAAELMVSLVQWFFIEISDTGQNLTKYEKELNYRIETAFTNKQANIAFVADNRKYIIDFSDMIEYPEGAKDTDQISVIRRDLVKQGNFEAPAHWTDFNGNQKVVTLQSTDKEYSDLETTFLNSAGKGFVVTKIERIMNKTLWTQYQAKKKLLEEQNPKGTQNERLLWHGTAPEAVDNINAHGFNRSYCGKNAAYYGDGVYFAVKADYSTRDTYSRPDASGVKRMYYCHVLTGEYTQGKKGMRVAPKKSTTKGSDSTSIYDSVVENHQNPNMFVIFHDTQAYPEYLIAFKKV